MPEFILDTSGHLPMPSAHGGTVPFSWGGLDDFTQGYIEALFFTWPEGEGDYIGGITSPSFTDLTPDTLARIIADCATFQRAEASLLALAYERDYDAAQAGRDLWFTRNGHGVGYWDREALEHALIGTQLTRAAETLRSTDAYLGDDDKVYLS